MSTKKLSPDDIEYIREFSDVDDPIDFAKHFDVSVNTIYTVMNKNRIPTKRTKQRYLRKLKVKAMLLDGKKVHEVIKQTGASYGTVSSVHAEVIADIQNAQKQLKEPILKPRHNHYYELGENDIWKQISPNYDNLQVSDLSESEQEIYNKLPAPKRRSELTLLKYEGN